MGMTAQTPSAFGFCGLSGYFLPLFFRFGPDAEGTLKPRQETEVHSFMKILLSLFLFVSVSIGQKGFASFCQILLLS